LQNIFENFFQKIFFCARKNKNAHKNIFLGRFQGAGALSRFCAKFPKNIFEKNIFENYFLREKYFSKMIFQKKYFRKKKSQKSFFATF